MEVMNCLLYLRVSSEEQVSNFSLDTQKELCEGFAKQQGYTVTKIFREEGVSAKTLNRPELLKLLEYARVNKKDVVSVVAYRIDRIARETSDYLAVRKKLLELGIKLESATEPTGDTPTQKFIETILAAGAELDNSIRAEKAKNGMKARFEAGLVNRPPLGYVANPHDKKGACLPDPKLFTLVKEAWQLMGTGTKTLPEIAEIMNDWGIRILYKKRLNKLYKQSVSKVFKNPFYYGLSKSHKYNKEVKGIHQPMISEELFFRVQDIISGRRNFPSKLERHVNNPQFALKGLVKCHCGACMVAGNVKGRSGLHYPFYWCPKGHGAKSVSAKNLEEMLLAKLSKLQPSQGAINLFTLAIHKDFNANIEKLNEIKKVAERKQIEQKQMMIKLVEGHMKGLYPDDIFKEQKDKLEDQLLVTGIAKNNSICEKYDIEGTIAFIKALLNDLAKAYQVSDYGQKRVLLGSIYPSGLIFNQGTLLNHDIGPIISQIPATSIPHVGVSARDRS